MSGRANPTNGAQRTTVVAAKRGRRKRATKAQQAARGRLLAEFAREGFVPSEDGVQAILRELGE